MSFLSQPLSLIAIKPQRSINPQKGSGTGPTADASSYVISAYTTLNESTNDTLTITKQPVQQGASISDHAYREPTTFNTTILFAANTGKSLDKLYLDLQNVQNSRILCDIVTPKRTYKNMMIAVLSQTTDKATENCLSVTLSFQEVIIVQVSTTQVPRVKQKKPGSTGATESAGKKSALASLKEGIGSLLSK